MKQLQALPLSLCAWFADLLDLMIETWHRQPCLHRRCRQASKFAPLAGEAPPFRLTTLDPAAELVYGAGFWSNRSPKSMSVASSDTGENT